LPNTPLANRNLGRLGLKPRPGPLFFLGAGSSPAMRTRLDPASIFFASVRELLVHFCYRKKVIKSEREWMKD